MLLASFKGTVAFGYFHPVVCMLVVVLAGFVALTLEQMQQEAAETEQRATRVADGLEGDRNVRRVEHVGLEPLVAAGEHPLRGLEQRFGIPHIGHSTKSRAALTLVRTRRRSLAIASTCK